MNAQLRLETLRELKAWAIVPGALQARIASVASGEVTEIAGPLEPRIQGRVAVLPVHGVIGQRRGWFTDFSTDEFGAMFADLDADSAVRHILLDFDTPGGTTYGVEEAAAIVREAKTPTTGLANSMAASAGWHLFSQTKNAVVTPSGDVGSQGVFMLHIDASKMVEDIGWKPTFVHAGKYKVEGNPFEPLSDEARAHYQTEVDGILERFVRNVAKGRGVSEAVARKTFGEGRLVNAKEAVSRGMVDRVATMPQLMRNLGIPAGRARLLRHRHDLAKSM